MGRLVKTHNGETVVVHNRVATPDYTLFVSDYAGGATPPHGWVYYDDDVEPTDFAAAWVQPTGAHDAYALGAIVLHNATRWRSAIVGNVWEPGVSGWVNADSDIPAWVQPTGAHDAYAHDAVVRHAGEIWMSTVEANVWAPGVSGWRRVAMVAPGDSPLTPDWVQPTGAHDAYPLGARVMHNNAIWESTVDANVWEPGVFGWVLV